MELELYNIRQYNQDHLKKVANNLIPQWLHSCNHCQHIENEKYIVFQGEKKEKEKDSNHDLCTSTLIFK